jgi:hypothetical protein
VSRRQDRPDAIAWFIRNHPEVTDAQIAKLLGTTKSTIDQVRNRTHWNAANIKPVDPVTLGLSTQLELDAVVRKAAEKRAKEDAKRGKTEEGPTLRPASETGALEPESEPVEAEAPGLDAPEADTNEVDTPEADDEDEA